jgi:hypothetical protein
MTRALATLAARARLRCVRRHPVTALAMAVLVAACGGSGQSGSAFVFLTIDRFSLDGQTATATVSSSTNPGTTTTVCVTLRNNPKNPTVTAPTGLDNVTIRSYTVTFTPVSGGGVPGSFTVGTAVLVPAGTLTNGALGGNTATFPVVVVPAGKKSSAGTIATAEFTFQGRDGRGQSVEVEGAVTVMFVSGADSVVTCGGTTGNGTNGTNGTTT